MWVVRIVRVDPVLGDLNQNPSLARTLWPSVKPNRVLVVDANDPGGVVDGNLVALAVFDPVQQVGFDFNWAEQLRASVAAPRFAPVTASAV